MKQLTLDKVIRKPRRGNAKGGRPPKNGVKAGIYQVLTKKPVQATEEEIAGNPRSRSAKLRAAERM